MQITELSERISGYCQKMLEGNLQEIERDILLDDIRKLYLLVKDYLPVQKNPEQTGMPKSEILVLSEKPQQNEIRTAEPQTNKETDLIVQTPVITVREQKVEEPAFSFAFESEQEVKVKPVSLNEIFSGEQRTLNQKHANTAKPALNDHAARTDFKGLIDLNKQYVLTNELFKGDSIAFQEAIRRINEAPGIEAAFEYIKTELLPKYKWSSDMQSARLFDKLVRQKFGVS